MKPTEIVETIREFFFDLIGYLIPGFITILILSVCIDPQYYFKVHANNISTEWLGIAILCISYILGYAIYSLAGIRDKLISKVSIFKIETQDEIEKKVKASIQYTFSLDIVKKIWSQHNSSLITNIDFSKISVRELRSIVMSYLPESDSKIYNFMFRAEICNFLSASTLLISLSGIGAKILNYFFEITTIFLMDKISMILYVILLITSVLFYKTRMRFLGIAIRLPFSIFIAKNNKIN